MTAFVVAADDRTGALETAGACADLGCDSVVAPHGIDIARERGCVVVDLASRHLSPLEAGARAAVISAGAAHKIDSTLRGNWAHELVARQRASRRAVLVVPAFPAAGRTCVDGVVLVGGVPVAEGQAASDVRGPVRSSRPVDHLRDAGGVRGRLGATRHGRAVARLTDGIVRGVRCRDGGGPRQRGEGVGAPVRRCPRRDGGDDRGRGWSRGHRGWSARATDAAGLRRARAGRVWKPASHGAGSGRGDRGQRSHRAARVGR